MTASSLLAIALSLVALTPAVAASPIGARKCQSRDLRYPFSAGGPKTFGAFRLRIASGRCATAHKVAKDWMTRFEAKLHAGQASPPRSVDGFSFANLPVRAAQTYRERGRRRTTTIWFDYVVPNG
ncbi:MAG TPA: hypothetical protein VJU80_05435 [Solirubrobacteraceae bacterium]|nr:hypothetical protein [Solirubrobacteraceae bacterium]